MFSRFPARNSIVFQSEALGSGANRATASGMNYSVSVLEIVSRFLCSCSAASIQSSFHFITASKFVTSTLSFLSQIFKELLKKKPSSNR